MWSLRHIRVVRCKARAALTLALLCLATVPSTAVGASAGVGTETPAVTLGAAEARSREVIVEFTSAAALHVPRSPGQRVSGGKDGVAAALDALLVRRKATRLRRVFRSFEDAQGRLIDTTRARVERVRARRLGRGRLAAALPAASQLPSLENYFLIEFSEDSPEVSLAALIAELEQSEYVVAAQPNYIYELFDETLPDVSYIPADPFVTTDGVFWSKGAFGNEHPDLYGVRNVRALEAFSLMDLDGDGGFDPGEGRPGEGIVIAIVDTGLDPTHADIAQNLFTNPGEIADDGIDNDANGFIDDVHGWDFVSGDADPYDGDGHGTHVSGTAAAAANAEGIIGLAPFAKILPLKGLNDEGSGSTGNLARALEYAASAGADVISNSWGGTITDGLISAAFDVTEAAGALSIAAAGNDGQPRLSFPANLRNVFSVGALDHTDELAYFSNYALDLDICAPGVDTLSLSAGDGDYETISGTSMAAPHVAGAAATLMSMFPGELAVETRGRLLAGGVNIDAANPGLERTLGAGRLDLLESAVATPAPALRIVRISATALVAGQPATLEIELENAWATVTAVEGRLLTGASKNVRVTSRAVQYGELGPGERKAGSFEIVAKPNLEVGDAINLRLVLGDASGAEEEFMVELNADYFEDVSEEATFQSPTIVAAGAAFADYDGDDRTDFAMSSALGALALYHNEGGGTFLRTTLRAIQSKRPVFADFDGDGDNDLLAAGAKGSELHENDGTGEFTELPDSGIDETIFSTGFTPIDLDGDGDLDVITTRPNFYWPEGSGIARSVDVLRNNGDLTFTGIWEQTELPRSMTHMQILTLDFDNDGLADLFGAGATNPGSLYRNLGDGTFEDVTTSSFPADTLACRERCEPVKTAAVGDYDNDGDLDIVAMGANLQDPENIVFQFFRNEGSGTFSDVSEETLSEPVSAMTGLWGAEFFDLENDGDLDLIAPFDGILAGGGGRVVEPTNVILRNNGDGTFSPISHTVFPIDTPLAAFVAAISDFDRDGGLDLLGAGGTTIIETGALLRNVANPRNHWLQVSLISRQSAPGGYGARVIIETNAGTQMREIHYGPMDSSFVHFGLGKARHVRSLEVRWPSGISQQLRKLSADQRLVLEEPAAK